jgi:integrase
MSLYKRGDVWWYKFVWRGELIRESTKQSNKRVAEQIEAGRKTQMAKGEAGIKDRVKCPTLGEFATSAFLPFVEKHSKAKPTTVTFYTSRVGLLKTFPRIWNAKLDAITAEDITAFIAMRQNSTDAVATINRDLATLRRMFKLAMEWKRVSVLLPTVKLLPSEVRRERVVSHEEEQAYLGKAALLLRDFATLEFDCGFRPEETHRLTWAQFRNGSIKVHTGKTKQARRSIPASPRLLAMLEGRRGTAAADDWIFPAPTKTGHINDDSLKKQHATALKASGVTPFVLYSLRHTCLTRWAESGMDAFTLKKLAGHVDIATTSRYIHMNDGRTRKALETAWKVQGGHSLGHTA